MRFLFLFYLLISAVLGKAQDPYLFDYGDQKDTYLGAKDTIISKNSVRVRNMFDCTVSSSDSGRLVERRVFNKDGAIDSVVKGYNISKGHISLVQTYAVIKENGNSVLVCTNKYLNPGHAIDNNLYYYLYRQEGNKYTLLWPKNEEGDVIIKIKYQLKGSDTLCKKVYDGRDKLVLDTILYSVVLWKQDQIQRQGIYVKERKIRRDGQNILFRTHYLDGRVMDDSMFFIKQDGSRRFYKRMIFAYDIKGRLIRESTIDFDGVLGREKRIFPDYGVLDNISYEVEDFVVRVIYSYRNDGQRKETIFYDNIPDQDRRYQYRYDNRSLLQEMTFSVGMRKVVTSCFTYEFF